MNDPIQKALRRIETLGQISDNPRHLVRTFLSPANKQAASLVLGWMEELGMHCSHAPDGTIRGVLQGSDPEARPLLLGSHLDTVIDAGRYDGALGVIAALAALETLAKRGVVLPFPVHVLGFSDEEGTRFHTTYLGSRSVTGPLDSDTLSARDASGRSLEEVIDLDGWHHGSTTIRYGKNSIRGYVELHIEQGRVLEETGQAACAVSAISGQTRLTAALTGRADHAGTTPMPLRRDALAGAAECILAAESLAVAHPPLVVTVGKIDVHPGVSNSIPQRASFTVDLRHPLDVDRTAHLAKLKESVFRSAQRRGLEVDWKVVQDGNAVTCDTDLTNALLDALEAITGNRLSLPSGAGHDGVAISAIGPVAMIFVRCRDGLSHHPDEYAAPEDITVGIEVLVRFLQSQ